MNQTKEQLIEKSVRQLGQLIDQLKNDFDYETNIKILDMLRNEIDIGSENNLHREVTTENVQAFFVSKFNTIVDKYMDDHYFSNTHFYTVYSKLIDSFKCISFEYKNVHHWNSKYTYEFTKSIFVLGNVHIEIYPYTYHLSNNFFLDINKPDVHCSYQEAIEKLKEFLNYDFMTLDEVKQIFNNDFMSILFVEFPTSFNDMANFY